MIPNEAIIHEVLLRHPAGCAGFCAEPLCQCGWNGGIGGNESYDDHIVMLIREAL